MVANATPQVVCDESAMVAAIEARRPLVIVEERPESKVEHVFRPILLRYTLVHHSNPKLAPVEYYKLFYLAHDLAPYVFRKVDHLTRNSLELHFCFCLPKDFCFLIFVDRYYLTFDLLLSLS